MQEINYQCITKQSDIAVTDMKNKVNDHVYYAQALLFQNHHRRPIKVILPNIMHVSFSRPSSLPLP